MADRYWVGGSGSWNSTTKWSTTSGGASGASVPTASDNAIFDAASGAAHYTVTVTANSTCANLTFTPVAADGVTQFAVDSGFVVAGTFSTSGTQGNRRAWFRSSTYGLTRDMQIAAIGTVTDVDFRDIRVTGAGGTLTGTRIGDLRGCGGITFSTPKNCYRIGSGDWTDNQWSATSGGSVSTDYFPLAQDTAIINQSSTSPLTLNTVITYTGAVDFSARTSAFTFNATNSWTFYGSLTLGSGVTTNGTNTQTFSGRNTQILTSAGKTLTFPITVDSYGGSVELADALNIGSNTLTVTNGTFDTKNYNVTAGSLSSSNSNVRTITLGSSTVTTDGNTMFSATVTTNLTFNAGTSTLTTTNALGSISGNTSAGPALTFYNVNFNRAGSPTITYSITGTNTFNNITVTATTTTGFASLVLSSNQTITGTLTVAGATAVRRIFVRSDTLGTQRTLNVGTLSATDCDFRDIAITGAAAGSSPTRAGDCGGNSGITFPAAKTVYWNLAGAQNWSATAWAPGSGGTPDINQFPLAQDTAVFDNTGSVTGTITIDQAWNIGTFDASLRTSAMTLTTSTNAPFVYGDWKFGTGVTSSSTSGTITFAKRGTQTITSNGVSFNCPVTVDSVNGTTQLADALSLTSARNFVLRSGIFDAVFYNLTCNTVNLTATTDAKTLKMGSGTWTLSGNGTVWDASSTTNLNFYKNTANIVLSDTSTTARTFAGGGLSYNKLTIGGTTGISTLTISGNNQFTELASTKTVAHTIALGTTTQTFGKWTVTGTAGNVVTLTGTGTSHILAGACTSGIDYLAMGSIGFAATSPGEFYAGANSTGTAAAPVYRTAKPADGTRYWVGGTGNWSDTARWSTASGGASGAAVPRSHDDVVFDLLSNATAYTATVDAVTGGIRMKSLTIAGPLVGNVTLAGSAAMVGIHGNVTLPTTGLTRTYNGAITFTGSTTGNTITTNGVTLASSITINGINCGWVLSSALDNGSSDITLTNGAFDTNDFSLTYGQLNSTFSHSRTLDFGSSTVSSSGTLPLSFGTIENQRANVTFVCGTSQLNCSSSSPQLEGNNQTFYNVAFTSTGSGTVTINGANSFNNLSFTGITAAGLKNIALAANQTVTGTLTFSAGTNATMRHFCRSDTIGTARTITAAAVSMTDVDFRDITIAGAAAPASGTRIGDCKGNSGITFTAATTRYWNLAAGGNWSATGWAASSGAAPAVNNFPLAQDTCVFEATGLNSGATITVNQSYNIGTIDMSARTANTMTLATGTTAPFIYGNWINGTGTTLSGTGTLTFSGRATQQLTSAGKTFTQRITIDSPGGSISLLDAFTANQAAGDVLTITSGTFDAATYNVTLSGATAGASSANSNTRTIAVGSGTWSIAGSGAAWNTAASTNLTVTGTGTISLTSASAKTFAGGGVAYTNITLNQGGAGTLTITGNNTFKTISNTSGVANTISLGTTTQTITTSWTAAGTAGNVQTVSGTSASSPGTLVFSGSGQAANVDYLAITGIRAYSLTTTWYAGANSTNNGSLGWIFASGGGNIISVSFSDTATSSDAISATLTLSASTSDSATALDSVAAGLVYASSIDETATALDSISAGLLFSSSFSDTVTALDDVSASVAFLCVLSETAAGSDTVSVAPSIFNPALSETATGQDTITASGTLNADVLELAAGTDAFSASSIFSALITETATAEDVNAASVVFAVSLSETATGSDLASAALVLPASFSDTATASDALSAQIVFVTSIAEQAAVSEVFAVAASIFNPAISETATGQDVASVAASTFGASLSETATGVDAVAAVLVLPASFSDTANAADAIAAQMVFATAVSEAATALDAQSALVVFVSAISETATGLDAPSVAASIFNPSLNETATGLDSPSVSASTFNVSFSDAGAISDLVGGSYLWNPIDDTQSANWQNIVNTQASAWTDVNTTQSASWQDVVTTQSPAWTDVNTTQGPGWVDIQT